MKINLCEDIKNYSLFPLKFNNNQYLLLELGTYEEFNNEEIGFDSDIFGGPYLQDNSNKKVEFYG